LEKSRQAGLTRSPLFQWHTAPERPFTKKVWPDSTPRDEVFFRERPCGTTQQANRREWPQKNGPFTHGEQGQTGLFAPPSKRNPGIPDLLEVTSKPFVLDRWAFQSRPPLGPKPVPPLPTNRPGWATLARPGDRVPSPFQPPPQLILSFFPPFLLVPRFGVTPSRNL